MKLTKRIFALALALCLILCLSISVFADEATTGKTEGQYEDMSTVVLKKTYEAANAGTSSPAETFTFTDLECVAVSDAAADITTGNAPVPKIASVTYGVGEAGGENKVKEITITLPTNADGSSAYTSVGKYTYKFKENAGSTAGVTYHNKDIYLVVTVIEQNGQIRVAAVHTEEPKEGTTFTDTDKNKEGTTKSDTFTNTYSAGSLSVKKIVTGNLGDKQKLFKVTVKFSAPLSTAITQRVKSVISYEVNGETKTIDPGEDGWTADQEVEIELKDQQTITFTNIPYGVTYTVTEEDYTSDGYQVTYDGDIDDNAKIDAPTQKVEITNTKNGTVDTGVYMDSLPYIVALAVALGGAVVLFTRKRHIEE